MDNEKIFNFCKNLGCCDACCFRYLGFKKPSIYNNIEEHAKKYKKEACIKDTVITNNCTSNVDVAISSNIISNETDNLQSKTSIVKDEFIKTENKTKNYTIDLESTEAVKITEDVKCNTNNGTVGLESSKIDNKDKVNLTEYVSTHVNSSTVDSESNEARKDLDNITEDLAKQSNIQLADVPPVKKRKINVCVSCVGVLQKEYWQESFDMIKEVLDKKGYECATYTCGLSAPISTLLREKIILFKIVESFSSYDPGCYTQLKDAWRFSFREQLATTIKKSLHSESPLMITVNMDYADDLQELEVLKTVSPELFMSRSKQRRRFPTEFTRVSVEKALEDASLAELERCGATLHCDKHAQCVSVVCVHGPQYLAGRYIKLSRNLPQSPWVLEGRRVLPTSVQEIMFEPLARLYHLSSDQAESRLKLIAAGREDVDVRCLGEGRPFAIELTDPTRQLKPEELQSVCESISKSGEETKCKSYEALCIKLSHSTGDDTACPVRVTERDCSTLNSYRNTEETEVARVSLAQKTPVRVLHRRPALTRTRHVLDVHAAPVPAANFSRNLCQGMGARRSGKDAAVAVDHHVRGG
ncbi:unnamed protein product [Leptidea sinapis]|uniref:tRNA pseudouridine(55) synthase n=1 Tax=Leptidea sinapis TaxID=189913 RepID=A0A5E4QSL5_9NEOP|nr:unnamed protein product [Leptidea sinapis]